MRKRRILPHRALLAATGCLVAMEWAGAAHASPNFPAALQQLSGWSCTTTSPQCTFCHNNPRGGIGTANTNFATYLKSRGLVMLDTTSLKKALAADQGEGNVSNSNGIKDLDALKQCEDPNTAGNVPGAGPQLEPPAYGCGARISPRTPPSSWWALPLIVFAIVGVAVRRMKTKNVRS